MFHICVCVCGRNINNINDIRTGYTRTELFLIRIDNRQSRTIVEPKYICKWNFELSTVYNRIYIYNNIYTRKRVQKKKKKNINWAMRIATEARRRQSTLSHSLTLPHSFSPLIYRFLYTYT